MFTTRWHGIITTIRFRPFACPTARHALGDFFTARARSSYEHVSPYGIAISWSHTARWNGVPTGASGTVNSFRVPAKYSASSFSARARCGCVPGTTGMSSDFRKPSICPARSSRPTNSRAHRPASVAASSSGLTGLSTQETTAHPPVALPGGLPNALPKASRNPLSDSYPWSSAIVSKGCPRLSWRNASPSRRPRQ